MKKNRFKEEFITTLNIEKKDFIKKFSGKFEHSEIDFFPNPGKQKQEFR